MYGKAIVRSFFNLQILLFQPCLVPSEEQNQGINLFPNVTIPFSITLPFKTHTPDFYIPFFTLAEMFAYMGWIKVAETLLNPFGDDDEDFQINYLIDRNLQVIFSKKYPLANPPVVFFQKVQKNPQWLLIQKIMEFSKQHFNFPYQMVNFY